MALLNLCRYRYFYFIALIANDQFRTLVRLLLKFFSFLIVLFISAYAVSCHPKKNNNQISYSKGRLTPLEKKIIEQKFVCDEIRNLMDQNKTVSLNTAFGRSLFIHSMECFELDNEEGDEMRPKWEKAFFQDQPDCSHYHWKGLTGPKDNDKVILCRGIPHNDDETRCFIGIEGTDDSDEFKSNMNLFTSSSFGGAFAVHNGFKNEWLSYAGKHPGDFNLSLEIESRCHDAKTVMMGGHSRGAAAAIYGAHELAYEKRIPAKKIEIFGLAAPRLFAKVCAGFCPKFKAFDVFQSHYFAVYEDGVVSYTDIVPNSPAFYVFALPFFYRNYDLYKMELQSRKIPFNSRRCHKMPDFYEEGTYGYDRDTHGVFQNQRPIDVLPRKYRRRHFRKCYFARQSPWEIFGEPIRVHYAHVRFFKHIEGDHPEDSPWVYN